MARSDRRQRASLDAWRVLAAGLVAVGSTGGCGPEADAPPSVQGRAVATYSDPSVYRVGPSELRRITDDLDPESPQRIILADGRVSRTEVERAWEDYAQCMRGVGFVVTTSVWDPVTTTTRIFAFARAGVAETATGTPAPTTSTTPPTTRATIDAMTQRESERADACEERYWFPVSAVYAADTPPRMERRLASAMQECMVRRGYAVQGITTFGGMVGTVRGEARGERVQAGRDCLATAVPALYPDLPYYPRP